jgi:uncharacterized membrane protein YdjX (TVP38/TMEM64 family)
MTADAEPKREICALPPEAPLGDVPPGKSESRIVFLALLVAVLLGIVYLSPLRSYLGRVQELSAWIRGLGWKAPLVLSSSVAVLVALGFPRLLFCVIAGMALGFWSGLLWTQLGTLMGNYVLFLVARKGGGDWVRRYIAKRKRLAGLIHNDGITGVILARQLPMPGLLVNLGFGLVSIRHRDFLIGTAIGQLPEAIPCTLIGAGVVKATFGRSVALIGLAVALAVIVWLGLRWVFRK